jgi:hypothetical protein
MHRPTLALCAIAAAASLASAQEEPAPKIAWYGTWVSGFAAAKRAQKPILLVAAAPHCRDVPGMW